MTRKENIANGVSHIILKLILLYVTWNVFSRFFLFSSIYFRFLMDLHVLGCPEHDLTIFGKCLCVCDKNFVASVARELMNRIS